MLEIKQETYFYSLHGDEYGSGNYRVWWSNKKFSSKEFDKLCEFGFVSGNLDEFLEICGLHLLIFDKLTCWSSLKYPNKCERHYMMTQDI